MTDEQKLAEIENARAILELKVKALLPGYALGVSVHVYANFMKSKDLARAACKLGWKYSEYDVSHWFNSKEDPNGNQVTVFFDKQASKDACPKCGGKASANYFGCDNPKCENYGGKE